MFRRSRNKKASSAADTLQDRGAQTPEIVFDVAWGGWYTQQDEDGSWGVFRLLDFNREAYHSMLFRDRFDELPSFEQTVGLAPLIQHVPIAAGQLVNFPAALLGQMPLSLDDLGGYATYLEHARGMPDVDRSPFLDRLVEFSTQPPLAFRMSVGPDGELNVSEA